MKKTLSNLLIIFAFFSFICPAQTSEAKKIDEFDQGYYADTKSRMYFIADTLAEQPNTKAYIIVYSGREDNPGISYRYANRLKNLLLHRRIDEKRVIAIGAGRKDKQITEVWIVPEGAKPPSPSVLFSFDQISASQPMKFDQYTIRLPLDGEWEVWDGIYEDEATRLTRLGEVLRQRRKLRLYIVVRSQGVYNYKQVGKKLPNGKRRYIAFRSQKLSDPIGFDRKLAGAEKRYLTKELGIEPSRIKTIGRDYSLLRDSKKITSEPPFGYVVMSRKIELWLVPLGKTKSIPEILSRSIK